MKGSRTTLASVPIKGRAAQPDGGQAPSPGPAPAAELAVGPPERAGTVSMNVRFPPAMHRRLKLLAFNSGRPISEHLLDAVEAYLGDDK